MPRTPEPRSAALPPPAALLLAFTLALAPALPAAAQAVPEADAPGRSIQGRLMVLGGATGLGGDGLHPYAGVEAGLLYGRFGVMGLGQYGDGNDFTSLLLAGGPAVRVADLGFASFTVYGGMGSYREEKIQSFERDMTILFGGLSVRIPMGRVSLGLNASYFQGDLEGDDVPVPTTLRGHRFSIGLGL